MTSALCLHWLTHFGIIDLARAPSPAARHSGFYYFFFFLPANAGRPAGPFSARARALQQRWRRWRRRQRFWRRDTIIIVHAGILLFTLASDVTTTLPALRKFTAEERGSFNFTAGRLPSTVPPKATRFTKPMT